MNAELTRIDAPLASSLAASLVHELRTPLSIVRTELHHLATLYPAGDFSTAVASCDRIAGTLKRLGDVANRRPRHRAIGLSALCRMLERVVGPELRPDEDASHRVTADPELVEEGLDILAGAIRSTFPEASSFGRFELAGLSRGIRLVSPVAIDTRRTGASRFFNDPPLSLCLLEPVLADMTSMLGGAEILFEPPAEILLAFRAA